jgi:hypothetical protein
LKSAEGEISIGNVVGRIKLLEEMSGNYETEIEFLASHFFEISLSDICELSYDVIRQVLSHEKLKIESEESIYEIISKRISSDVRYFDLLELIRFEFVSQDCFREYLEFVTNSFEYFTLSHWISLQSRLLLPVESKSSNDRLMTRCLSFQPSPPLLGIIAHLTSQFGGNVHDRGVVLITTNRTADDHPVYAAKNVADLGNDSFFHSANKSNQWICFDFKTMKIRPTHYSVRTHGGGPDFHHLKNWVIEGSADGTSWNEIDRHENNTDLNSSLAVKTFSVCKVDTFRMIRLCQIGRNHGEQNYLIFTAFELFGSLICLQ